MIIRNVSLEQQELIKQFLRELYPYLFPERWTIVEDVTPTEFKVEDLEFVSYLNQEESGIRGEELRKHAVGLKADFGFEDGRKILAKQDKLPVDLRGKHIVLTGTLLRDPDGWLNVPSLRWRGGRWVLIFDGFGYDRWYDGVRLPRCK